MQRQDGQVQAFSDEWPVHDHDNLLLDTGHPGHGVKYLGYCKKLRRQHGQVQAFPEEWPVQDHDDLLPDLDHPAFRARYLGVRRKVQYLSQGRAHGQWVRLMPYR